MPVPPIPLSTNGYIDDAAAALQTSNVYVSNEVANAPARAQQLDQQVGDASIGIAVFSDNAGLEGSASDIVRELASADTGYKTIIVAVGDDVAAGSSALGKGEALRIANEAEQSNGSVDAALTQTVQQVIAATPAPASSGMDAGPVIGFAVAVALLLGAGIAAVGIVRSRRRRPADRGLPDGARA